MRFFTAFWMLLLRLGLVAGVKSLCLSSNQGNRLWQDGIKLVTIFVCFSYGSKCHRPTFSIVLFCHERLHVREITFYKTTSLINFMFYNLFSSSKKNLWDTLIETLQIKKWYFLNYYFFKFLNIPSSHKTKWKYGQKIWIPR